MKPSKISENALKRSVLKNIHSVNKDVILGARVAGDYSLIDPRNNLLVTSVNSVALYDDICIDRAFDSVLLDLICAKATPVAVSISMMLADKTLEDRIAHIVTYCDELATQYGVEITGGHTEICAAVLEPVLTICAYGLVADGEQHEADYSSADIVQVGRISEFGTSILAKRFKSDLMQKMSADVVKTSAELYRNRTVFSVREILSQPDILYMHNVSTGGIFAALWEVGSATGCGLSADLRSILIYQETIEVCEALGLNPYSLATSDVMLVVTKDGDALVESLNGCKVHASVLGKLNDSNDRVLINNGEVRYLEMPRGDDIYKVLGGRD